MMRTTIEKRSRAQVCKNRRENEQETARSAACVPVQTIINILQFDDIAWNLLSRRTELDPGPPLVHSPVKAHLHRPLIRSAYRCRKCFSCIIRS